jgi:hypothetical protein
MIEQILSKKANFLSKESKKVYNWCLKNIPPEGIKIMQENYNKFLKRISNSTNEPVNKLLQKISITSIWKIKWLIEIARLPNDKTKIKAIKKIAQNSTKWKYKDVKQLCAELRKIEEDLNPKIKQKTNNNSNLELILKMHNIDFSKIQNIKNKKLATFFILLNINEELAKTFALSNIKVINFLNKGDISNEELIKLTKDKIIEKLLENKKTFLKTLKIISITNFYEEV